MDELERQVRRARRRLTFQSFLNRLGWCWFYAFLAALAAIFLRRWIFSDIAAIWWLLDAFFLGFLVAIGWTVFTSKPSLEAAIEIDRRFGLKERISSALALEEEDRNSEMGRAVEADALHCAVRINVAERFVVRPPRPLLLPLLPVCAALLLAVFWHPAEAVSGTSSPGAGLVQEKPDVKKATENVRRELEKRKEEAKKGNLEDAERLFNKIEKGVKELAEKPEDKEKTLAKLNELSRQIQERREALGGSEKLKEQMERMKSSMDRGPADKLAQALSKGDFQKAIDELQKIRDELSKSNLSDEQKEALAKQLDQMSDKLNKIADAHQKAQEDLKKQIEKAQQLGQKSEAQKLQQQLQQLQQQQPQMNALKGLASKMGMCKQSMKSGNSAQACQAMQDMQSSIAEMQSQMAEMAMLDSALEQMAQAKNQMNCQGCQGQGCKMCQGNGDSDPDLVPKSVNSKGGLKAGHGTAFGVSDKEELKASHYNTQAKQQMGQGPVLAVDQVEGPNIKGNVTQQIQTNVEATKIGTTDPLSGRSIPKKQSKQANEYMDKFLEGE